MTRQYLSYRRLLAISAAGLLAAGLAACGSSPSSAGKNSSSASSTLVMESSPESAITQDFNPFEIGRAHV